MKKAFENVGNSCCENVDKFHQILPSLPNCVGLVLVCIEANFCEEKCSFCSIFQVQAIPRARGFASSLAQGHSSEVFSARDEGRRGQSHRPLAILQGLGATVLCGTRGSGRWELSGLLRVLDYIAADGSVAVIRVDRPPSRETDLRPKLRGRLEL